MNRRRVLRIATTLAMALLLSWQGPGAFAQAPQSQPQQSRPPGGGRMSQEDRARLREDLGMARRDMYKGQQGFQREPGAAPQGQLRRMSPEQHDRLRRDLEDANRGMPHHR